MAHPRPLFRNERPSSDSGEELIIPLTIPNPKYRKRGGYYQIRSLNLIRWLTLSTDQRTVDDAREYVSCESVGRCHGSAFTLPRNHFSQFAQCLQCVTEDIPSKATSNVSEHAFATLYDLRSNEDPKHISTVHDFEALAANPSDKRNGRILFLRGLPSPEWLGAIGVAYTIDPDFFRRHIDFRPALGRSNFFSDPYLPSASTNMYRLLQTTIGEVPLGDQGKIGDLQ
jgi:hypothetical protein